MLHISIFEVGLEFMAGTAITQVMFTCSCGTSEIFNYHEVATASPMTRYKFCRECGHMIPQIELLLQKARSPWYRLGMHGLKI